MQITKIAAIINSHGDYWAELDDGDYLLKFGRRDYDGNNLVLMPDLGVTWEPFRAYPTPRYCSITIEDVAQAARNLMKLADCYAREELPEHCKDGSFQHLIAEAES
jgi:hypothetical protein